VSIEHLFAAETQAVHHAGPEVLDQHVRMFDDAGRQFLAAFLLEIDRDVQLAAVLLHEVAAHAVPARSEKARQIAFRRLEFDDLGAEIREDAGARRAGENAAEIRYADTAERRIGGFGRFRHRAIVAAAGGRANRPRSFP
jgi:hypothetical protein